MRPAAISLLTLLHFGLGVLGDASSKYTAQLLDSGKIKLGEWQEAYDKAYAFVQSLNTTEKLAIITDTYISIFDLAGLQRALKISLRSSILSFITLSQNTGQ
jgi:beta-glucosidase